MPLYNVKTTPAGTLSVAVHIFMNTFVAAKLEGQISDFASGNVFDLSNAENSAAMAGVDADTTETSVQSTAAAAIPTIAGSLGKAASIATLGLAKRGAEGGTNLLLFRKLGFVCIQYLRPIKP